MNDQEKFAEFTRRSQLIDAQIAKADALEAERQTGAAFAAYRDCFDLAVYENVPLYMHQLVHIWVGVGFCYADRNQWPQAIQMYRLVDTVLKSALAIRAQPHNPSRQTWEITKEWAEYLPLGVHIIATQDYDPSQELVNLYESLALAHDNTDQVILAREYYQLAIEGHQRFNQPESAMRVWLYMATGHQRRQDWENLRPAATELLQLATQLKDTPHQIKAWQFLAQVGWNQLRMFDAIENLKLAIAAERQTRHPDLERDEKVLADFLNGLAESLRRKIEKSRSAAALPARFGPLSAFFTNITIHKAHERGAPQLVFVIHTHQFDEAAQALRLFHLQPLPVALNFLRQQAPALARSFPPAAEFQIEWNLPDLDPTRPIGTTSLPASQRQDWMLLNAREMQFAVVLQAVQSSQGQMRQELVGRYEQYLLDWAGMEGAATYIRSYWDNPQPEHVRWLLEVLEQRLQNYGLATGLLTQSGFLYRLLGDFARASDCYLREIQAGLRPDGQPGWGTLTALCNLGTVYKKQQDFERARLCYSLALTLNPNYFEPLVSLPGILEDLSQQMLCLSRAYRLRPDEPFFKRVTDMLCAGHPHAAGEILHLIKETSALVDLAQPLSEFLVPEPASALPGLLAQIPSPPGVSRATTANRGALTSLEQIQEVLAHFASAHSPAPRRLSIYPTWGVTIENMAMYAKDLHGKVSVKEVPGAVLQLAYAPDLMVRVELNAPNCTVYLMFELPTDDAATQMLKALATETVPARAEFIFNVISGWMTTGLLEQAQGQWRCRVEK